MLPNRTRTLYEYGMTTAPASSPVLPEEPQGAECDDARRVFFVIYNANAGRMRGGALKQLETFFSSRALDARFSTLDACDWGAVRALLRRGHEVRFVVAAAMARCVLPWSGCGSAISSTM